MTTLKDTGLRTLLLPIFLALAGCGPSQDGPVRPPLSTAAEPATKTFETAAKITPRTDGVVGFDIETKDSHDQIVLGKITCTGTHSNLKGVKGVNEAKGVNEVNSKIVQAIEMAEAACDELLTKRNDRQDLALGPQ